MSQLISTRWRYWPQLHQHTTNDGQFFYSVRSSEESYYIKLSKRLVRAPACSHLYTRKSQSAADRYTSCISYIDCMRLWHAEQSRAERSGTEPTSGLVAVKNHTVDRQNRHVSVTLSLSLFLATDGCVTKVERHTDRLTTVVIHCLTREVHSLEDASKIEFDDDHLKLGTLTIRHQIDLLATNKSFISISSTSLTGQWPPTDEGGVAWWGWVGVDHVAPLDTLMTEAKIKASGERLLSRTAWWQCKDCLIASRTNRHNK